MSDVKSVIESGRAVLGIEFGSTRIKGGAYRGGPCSYSHRCP